MGELCQLRIIELNIFQRNHQSVEYLTILIIFINNNEKKGFQIIDLPNRRLIYKRYLNIRYISIDFIKNTVNF